MIQPLILPATEQSLTPAINYVMAAAQAAGLDKKAVYRLRLAVDEVATNIVHYAYSKDLPGATFEVRAEIADASLAITLVDSGVPFDPRQARAPDLTQDLEDRPIGGLGVYLAIRNVDQFNYERVDNQNHNTFIVRRPVVTDKPV